MDENVAVLVLPFPTMMTNVFTQTEVAEPPIDEVDPLGADSPGKRKRVDDTELGASREIKKAKFETKALKAKRPGFTEERYNETSYYVENALRKVYPYYFTFTTFTKGRWVGEKILDVFSKEFRAHPAEEYARCIKSGTLTVNYEQVELDYRLKHNDLLANIVHRHEVPVTCEPIKVLHLDDELLVVNKPASIPVHPCGRYRHNTVVFILAKEHNLKNLRTVHRLDRLTSGLLLFGRTPNKARIMEGQIRNRQVEKEYVCRVEGNFPEEEIVCCEKIEVVSYKIGVCKVSDNGKECRTVFKKLSYNGKTSVVLAKPHTGRMHQIRVHLQFLGYPIINDPLYNHEVFGPNKGKGGVTAKTDEQLVSDLINLHNAENWLGIGDGETLDAFPPSAPAGLSVGDTEVLLAKDATDDLLKTDYVEAYKNGGTGVPASSTAREANKITIGTQTSEIELGSNGATVEDSVDVTTETVHESEQRQLRAARAAKPQEFAKDPFCYECKVKYRDPKPEDLVMYLHALSYKGPDWCYKSPLPEWANEDWTES